jgi:hypothetical protein
MSEILIETETEKTSMTDCRPALDAALREEFPGGMMRSKWAGDVLELSGPGAKGTITLEGGRLVGRAELGPPASLMRPLIEQKISTLLRKAAQ